jgi:serine/threonine protein kinase
MDDSDVVKIGDFGLSRESGAQSGDDDDEVEINTTYTGDLGYDHDNTAGVGTSSYASPEQMSGSIYDSSSDVYSLGIILFELCYPMHTGMERMRVFDSIRRKNFVFPEKWHLNVAKHFPSVHRLLLSMLSHDPKERPTASEVAADIESLLSEYTVLSLDQSSILVDGVIFVRVETEDTEGSLARTINIIKDLSPVIHIHQYGLRVKGSKKIMEFALSVASDATNGGVTTQEHLRCLFEKLEAVDDIKNVRQIKDTVDLSENRRKQSV